MKKFCIILMSFLFIGLPQSAGTVYADNSDGIFFVSPAGSDNNEGTREQPFLTIEKALLRAQSALLSGDAEVVLLNGEYAVSETINISNSTDNRLTVRGEDSAVITHGTTLESGEFSKVTDAALLSKIYEESARDNIYSIDLNSYGITDFGVPYQLIHESGVIKNIDFYIDDIPMTIARYPDSGYLNVQSGIGKNKFSFSSDREINIENAYAFGWFYSDWRADTAKILNVSGEIYTLEREITGNINNKARFYFYNMFSELSSDGEYYLDEDTGMLYVCSKTPVSQRKISFSTNKKDFIQITSSKNTELKNLTLENGAGRGIVISEKSENISLNGITIRNVAERAVFSSDCQNVCVFGCKLYNLGGKGIYILGGNRNTLTSCESIISGNEIYNFSMYEKTYSPAILVGGCGITVSNNKIHDAPHSAVILQGNNHIIENNEIYDVIKETNDAGAVYMGRNQSERGNIIRNNYFHDISGIGKQAYSVYADDLFCGVNVYNNLFYNVKCAALFGGGSDNIFRNNLIIAGSNGQNAAIFDQRGLENGWSEIVSAAYEKFAEVPYKKTLWKKTYPEIANVSNENPAIPKRCVIKDNIICGFSYISAANAVKQYGTVENNRILSDNFSVSYYYGKLILGTDIFGKYENLPEFNPKNIGVRESYDYVHQKDSNILEIFSDKFLNTDEWNVTGSANFLEGMGGVVISNGGRLNKNTADCVRYPDTDYSDNVTLEFRFRLIDRNTCAAATLANGKKYMTVSARNDGIYYGDEKLVDMEFGKYVNLRLNITGETANIYDGFDLIKSFAAPEQPDDLTPKIGIGGGEYTKTGDVIIESVGGRTLADSARLYKTSQYTVFTDKYDDFSKPYQKSGFRMADVKTLYPDYESIYSGHKCLPIMEGKTAYLTYLIPEDGELCDIDIMAAFSNANQTDLTIQLSADYSTYVDYRIHERDITVSSFYPQGVWNFKYNAKAAVSKFKSTYSKNPVAVRILLRKYEVNNKYLPLLRTDLYYKQSVSEADAEITDIDFRAEYTPLPVYTENFDEECGYITDNAAVSEGVFKIGSSSQSREGLLYEFAKSDFYFPQKINDCFSLEFDMKINKFLTADAFYHGGRTADITVLYDNKKAEFSIEKNGVYKITPENTAEKLCGFDNDNQYHTYKLICEGLKAALYRDGESLAEFTAYYSHNKDNLKFFGIQNGGEYPEFTLDNIKLSNLCEEYVIHDDMLNECVYRKEVSGMETEIFESPKYTKKAGLKLVENYIPTSGSVSGYVVYEVPENYEITDFSYTSLFFGAGTTQRMFDLSADGVTWDRAYFSSDCYKRDFYYGSDGFREIAEPAGNILNAFKAKNEAGARYLKITFSIPSYAESFDNSSLIDATIRYRPSGITDIRAEKNGAALTALTEDRDGKYTLVLAGFCEGRLKDISYTDSPDENGILRTNGINFEECDAIEAFLFDKGAFLKPVYKKYLKTERKKQS